MPGGWNPLLATIRSYGPVGLWGFQELNAGQAVTAGGQDPQNFAFDASENGNKNLNATVSSPYPNGNYLQIGSGVTVNAQPIAGSATPAINDDSAALFPSTGTTSTANIITGGSSQPAILQPTAAISVACQVTPNVCVTGSTKQVMVCYGSDASSLAAYKLYHSGSTAVNHTFAFAVNIAGTPTTWVSPTAGVCSTRACTITIGNTNTAGQVETWVGGAGGTGVVYVKSDVVL